MLSNHVQLLSLLWLSAPIAFGVTSGCGSGLSQGVPEVRIIAVDPSSGSVEGGTLVEITGFGFSGDVVVWFDGSPVPTTRVDDFTLVVSSPAAGQAGSIDIKVTTEFGDATAPDGFRYTDGAVTTIDTGTGSAPGTTTATVTPTGLTGGIAQFVLTQIACPTCFVGWFASDVDIWVEVALHEPVSASWTDWWPTEGTCVNNPVSNPLSAQRYDVGIFAYLTSGGVQVTLDQQGGPFGPSYGAADLQVIDFVHPVYYDLTAPGGSDLGAVNITDAVLTPSGFATINPESIIYTDQLDAFSAQFSRSAGAGIGWSPTGPGTVDVLLMVFSADGSQIQGSIFCREWDDGYMVIPSNALQPFPVGSAMAIYVHRTEYTESVIPNNGHTLQSVSQMGVLGTGIISP